MQKNAAPVLVYTPIHMMASSCMDELRYIWTVVGSGSLTGHSPSHPQGHQRTPGRHGNGHHQPLHPGGPQQAPGGGPPARTHALRLGQAPAADPRGDQPAAEAPGALRRGAGGGLQEDLRPPGHPVCLQPLLQVQESTASTLPGLRGLLLTGATLLRGLALMLHSWTEVRLAL